MKLRSLFVNCVVTALGAMPLLACGGAGRSDDSADEGALQRSKLDSLAQALKGRGTLQMPPTGRREEANQLESKVTVAALSDDIDALARKSAKSVLADRYSLSDSVLERVRVSEAIKFDEDDTNFESGVSGQTVEEYLASELVSPSHRQEIEALIRDVPGKYYRLLMFNRAAELLADEWLFIVPSAPGGKVLAVHIAYSYE